MRRKAARADSAEARTRYLADRGTARALAGKPATKYVLRLFTAGSNVRSLRAVENVRQVCEQWLAGRAELQVIDMYQQPELAVRDSVVAAPCLIRERPQPRQVYIGDMSDIRQLRDWLGIRAAAHAGAKK